MASFVSGTFNNTQYEYPYGIQLLDDLHNILPEVMYDTSVFQTSPLVRLLHSRMEQLFPQDYVRNRTHYRLFQQERRRVQMSNVGGLSGLGGMLGLHTTPPTHSNTTTYRFGGTNAAGRAESTRFPNVSNITIPIQTTFTHEDLTSAILLALAGDATPVPVTPSQEVLATNTVLTSTAPDTDYECAVCQSHEFPSDGSHQWRILRPCRHAFHKTCIDRWFSQNVHCPVCRHDIRENILANTGADSTSGVSDSDL